MKKFPAIFLDRDGTLIEEVGYLDRLERLKLFPDSARAIRLINSSGMKAVVATNQSGIARGYFTESVVEMLNDHLQKLLQAQGAQIDRFYYCPHHPTEGLGVYRIACTCRKPEAGMLRQAAEDMNLDLSRSYLIGDKPTDIEAASRAGIKSVLIRSGHLPGQSPDLFLEGRNAGSGPDWVAANLFEAVCWILQDRQS
ncbi:D-alpha,beta-D-heptose 1,7-bisphosphate phosphatase [Syntrophus gentianae]|uniref:D,D-heptose 1,7-bisphosphate phosphatase n=1 Tax=Syntrophus gentianae TaxID=43775 RepID=A0A1H8B5T3_9BACT|nr:HAD family hydrolase [Syntrophus gentianae]SEM78350.1 D-alpha,beta-D-heptose 1,7-bisphosphate phosphatase [Syntrophus gentianae]